MKTEAIVGERPKSAQWPCSQRSANDAADEGDMEYKLTGRYGR